MTGRRPLVRRVNDGHSRSASFSAPGRAGAHGRNRAADAALTAELSRWSGADGFDEEALADLDSEAIEFAAASQCCSEHRALREKSIRHGYPSRLHLWWARRLGAGR